jgi:hypothetical protein
MHSQGCETSKSHIVFAGWAVMCSREGTCFARLTVNQTPSDVLNIQLFVQRFCVLISAFIRCFAESNNVNG